MMDLTKVPLNEYGHVQTRGKLPVRLLCINLNSIRGMAVAYAAKYECGQEDVYCCDESGRNGNDSMDLIPVPRKVRVRGWLNVYSGGKAFYAETREAANHLANISRIACIEIDREVTEGEGL